jgi:hypothetical protein
MATGHGRFAFLNRTGNVLVRGVLRSPLHPLISGRFALITVTGRRSGREFTFPVGYERDGAQVVIDVGWPERKLWWRNLREPAVVRVRLGGTEHIGRAVAHGDERSGVKVVIDLDPVPDSAGS